MTDHAIETDGLWKEFGATLAVADLSLSVARGEVFGFLGPNGAGKTTSIKMLLGLVRPTGGDGHVLGRPIGDRAARRRLGFLPEHFQFHETLTARELLRFHGRLHGLRGPALEARIDALVSRVDLSDAADRQLRTYSKGMLQRAGLARALVNDPELVFLDEPTSGLDPLGRRLVRDVIAELKGHGVAVFVNSHLLGEIEATCDRVAFVKHGFVVHEMSLDDGETDAVDLRLRVTPIDDGLMADLARFGSDVRREDGNAIRLRLARPDAAPDVVRWLVARGARVHAVETIEKSLEAWFVDVIGEDQRPG